MPEYEYIRTERNLIVNRRFLNLATACDAYLDHTPHHLKRMEGVHKHAYSAEFEKYTHVEYDSFLEYRVMYEMRNSIQHVGYPFTVTYHDAWIGEDEDRRKQFCSIVSIEIDRLDLDKKFKRNVRAELQMLGEPVDVMPMVRQYVGSLGHIHEKVRNLLRADLKQWEITVFEALEEFTKNYPDERTIGLWAVECDNDEKILSRNAWLEKNPIDYRPTLEKRNRNLKTLAQRYVTSEGR
jgi:hypothetical protein